MLENIHFVLYNLVMKISHRGVEKYVNNRNGNGIVPK